MTRVLVVDDEPTLVASIQFNLQREGYDVITANDGREAMEVYRNAHPDLIVLDLMMGEMSGFEVCRAIRAESNLPIIMLSARISDIDKVVGLELGADDYVTKPFSMHELLARVRAHLRRRVTTALQDEEILSAGSITLDPGRREVMRAGLPVELKPKEFDLLAYLIKNRGRVLTRAQIMQSVWGYELYETTRTVDVHIGRLRGKLEESPDHPRLILTMRGYGYCFSV